MLLDYEEVVYKWTVVTCRRWDIQKLRLVHHTVTVIAVNWVMSKWTEWCLWQLMTDFCRFTSSVDEDKGVLNTQLQAVADDLQKATNSQLQVWITLHHCVNGRYQVNREGRFCWSLFTKMLNIIIIIIIKEEKRLLNVCLSSTCHSHCVSHI